MNLYRAYRERWYLRQVLFKFGFWLLNSISGKLSSELAFFSVFSHFSSFFHFFAKIKRFKPPFFSFFSKFLQVKISRFSRFSPFKKKSARIPESFFLQKVTQNPTDENLHEHFFFINNSLIFRGGARVFSGKKHKKSWVEHSILGWEVETLPPPQKSLFYFCLYFPFLVKPGLKNKAGNELL